MKKYIHRIKPLNWTEARKLIFEEINSKIENSNVTNYRILGYKFLSVKLVLEFDDCHQYFEFNYFDNFTTIPCELHVSHGFTKDFVDNEYFEAVSKFSADWEAIDLSTTENPN